MSRNTLKRFFQKHRSITFVNPIRVYSQHRRQIVNDFPAHLPPEEEENIFTMTMLLEAIQQNYQTEPMKTEPMKTEKRKIG